MSFSKFLSDKYVILGNIFRNSTKLYIKLYYILFNQVSIVEKILHMKRKIHAFSHDITLWFLGKFQTELKNFNFHQKL